ncbi:MAG: hypothetical protein BWY31_02719 [Lentisphaerae bacterium ADurb.Bin242]|nr:MAG: hypothetical protein BWY31_02719 [Lentisphaerae bacterium ADurb.Bin242]
MNRNAAPLDLPVGSAPEPLRFDHFPNRLACFLFRNHGFVSPGKLAALLGTSVEKIAEASGWMGLPAFPCVDPGIFRERGYISLLRQNWHLLPYSQLLELLDISAAELKFRLKEDDFLFGKLGGLKPAAEELRWHDFSAAEIRRMKEIGAFVRSHFDAVEMGKFTPFCFGKRASLKPPESCGGLRLSYPYSAGCGDPLSDDSLENFSEKMLAEYADSGINALWFQALLYKLAPWERAPGMSEGRERRMRNLNRISERAANFGIGIYLYFNEPRTVPAEFAPAFDGLKGLDFPNGAISLCTSRPEVRDFLRGAMKRLFTECPALAGILTITRSENPTNCASQGRKDECPRCSLRSSEEIIAEVVNTFTEGMAEASPKARHLAHSWAWEEDWIDNIVRRLKGNVTVLAVSEWGVRTDCEGVKSEVIDYSISHPGPGCYARKVWKAGTRAGLRNAAKIQVNNSWELSAIPYLPVFDLIREHIDRLRTVGIDDFMLCWTHGGGPSPLLALFSRSKEEVLRSLYGEKAVPHLFEATAEFSRAFAGFPFDFVSAIYFAPVNCGPMNLLFPAPTHYSATMVGFPYDDLAKWRGKYSGELFSRAFARMAAGWAEGLKVLEKAEPLVPDGFRPNFDELKRYSLAAYCHLKSTWNQIEFIRLRENPAANAKPLRALLLDEIELAETAAGLQCKDACIGFEASNHYFYTPVLLMEKAVNCKALLARTDARSGKVHGSKAHSRR